MPQRTFSPRSFMGDRGISIDSFGRVLKNDILDDDDDDGKIVAPKPWKPSHSKSLSNSKFVDENLFEEAGQEIQTIILHSFNIFEDSTSDYPQQQQQQQSINNQHQHSADILLTSTPTITKPAPKSSSSNSNNNNQHHFSTITTYTKPKPSKSSNNNNNNNSNIDSNSISDSFTSISQTIGNLIENYSQDSLIELKIPFFSHSPCFSADPIPLTPPTRTHNPITLNQAFTNGDSYGVEIGLLSISPPLHR
ncbi:hypothetical protein DLAC_09715 [Tieghemostelium lacteum]|uniref:Uncharacterized protein n=1 Tax=Tieghemostelium lacteum TaxID=361077 RepID=A0A151Z740_TIELA|nr:hypothetical protein DLAC_09715 [Tieghemostelium lacteum]|eukprot:KYQ89747.1 hypothetical protein DLAC_09715 [Tieghemostelium lacteum]